MIETWYTFKHKVFPRFLAIIGKRLLTLLTATYRYRVTGVEEFVKLAATHRCVALVWHHKLLLAPKIFSDFGGELRYAALISQSRDGEIIAAITESYTIATTIRVAHSARKRALDSAIDYLMKKKGVLIVTPDGPKGPPLRIKKGSIYIAKSTGAKIVPVSWSASSSWKLSTWDKMEIPKPFSTVSVQFGEAVELAHSSTLPTSEEVRKVEEALNFNSNPDFTL